MFKALGVVHRRPRREADTAAPEGAGSRFSVSPQKTRGRPGPVGPSQQSPRTYGLLCKKAAGQSAPDRTTTFINRASRIGD